MNRILSKIIKHRPSNGSGNPKFEQAIRKAEYEMDTSSLRAHYHYPFRFHVIAAVVAITAMLVTYIIEKYALHELNIQHTLAVFLLFHFITEWIITRWDYDAKMEEYNNNSALLMAKYNDVEQRFTKQLEVVNSKAEDIDAEYQNLVKHLKAFFIKAGITYDDQTKYTDLLNELATASEAQTSTMFKTIFMSDEAKLFEAINSLLSNGTYLAKYKQQIDLAGIFCRLTTNRFWATSTDRLSDFQKKNNYYYHALHETASRIGSAVLLDTKHGKLPSFGRIFVGELHSFAADIIDNPQWIFDLYKSHITWGKFNNKDHYPIRFYIDDTTTPALSYDGRFRSALFKNNKIRDFMVVDNALVYGREGEYSDDGVTLKMFTDKNLVDAYAAFYLDLWNDSISIELLAQKIVSENYLGFDTKQKETFCNLCRVAESKLSIKQDYSEINTKGEIPFTADTFEGNRFFDRVCYYIAQTENMIVAVDRADKKTGNFWRAWLDSKEYIDFQKACIAATRVGGASVYRIFILERELDPKYKENAAKFISQCINNSIHIGFVYSKDLIGNRLELNYVYDFILVNMPKDDKIFSDDLDYLTAAYNSKVNRYKQDCLGFELIGDQSFYASVLRGDDNLISKDLLMNKLLKFRELWLFNGTIKLQHFTKKDESDLIDKLFPA